MPKRRRKQEATFDELGRVIIPIEIVAEAFRFALQFPGDQEQIRVRWLRNWARKRFRDLMKRVSIRLDVERRPVLKPIAEVIGNQMRPPERRLPEPKGFEMDHQEDDPWRRFHIPKPWRGD